MFSTSVGQGIQSGSDVAWQAFFDALRQAVSSTAPLQARLGTLVLAVCTLQQDNFLETDAWRRFQKLLHAATGGTAKPSPAKILEATASMTEQDAAHWLQEAVRIFSDVAQEEEL